MSGLEVIGLVVGILPLAVQAVKSYRNTLSGVANVDRDLNALIRDLETEHVRLRTTCEVLFDGVAPLSIIDKLIETPFGPDWKPYNEKLRLRLWTESGQFEEQVAEMQKAAEDLKAKLAIDENGKTKLTDRIAIVRELRRRTSFTLKKKDYDEVMARIKTANSVLHELTGKTCGLEPNRRRRSQARLNNLIRTLTRSIFNALCRATTCFACAAQGVSRTSKWLTSLSFRPARETSISATQTLVEVSQSLIIPPSQTSTNEPPALSNLCQAVFKRQKEPAVDYYGYITDIERKFGLYPGQDELDYCKAVTLRQVLAGEEPDLPRFDYPEKLRVALTLCASILHLHSTPWLARILTLDDVVFLREDGPLPPHADSLYRPYLIKILRESDSSTPAFQKCKSLNTPRPMNLAMLALGALLIQVIIGKPDHELEITATDMPSILSKSQAGNRLGDQILESGGINYADAVKWCLKSLFGTAGLDNDTFCQNFYVEVVARLEEDVALLNNEQ
ncbi:hypothetical protein EDB81DRAFT_666170 [Dactylonectria macrodidyma]|uniref:DUF7580 domain-containing protein n=1 Tax=Dactylonectria macrodidyma TaxID=307937 RepID=A0A9P9DM85_9HYPO|nr:hypothetical protein EDB81DRAFT_666170 [Dactylonectria macrodidyma]